MTTDSKLDKPDRRSKIGRVVLTFRCSFCKEASDVAVGGKMVCLSCGRWLSLADGVTRPQ